jgi:hypothetical protein
LGHKILLLDVHSVERFHLRPLHKLLIKSDSNNRFCEIEERDAMIPCKSSDKQGWLSKPSTQNHLFVNNIDTSALWSAGFKSWNS